MYTEYTVHTHTTVLHVFGINVLLHTLHSMHTHTYEPQRRRSVNGSSFDITFHAVNVRYYGMKFVPRISEKPQMIHAIIVFGQKIDKTAEHLLN